MRDVFNAGREGLPTVEGREGLEEMRTIFKAGREGLPPGKEREGQEDELDHEEVPVLLIKESDLVAEDRKHINEES